MSLADAFTFTTTNTGGSRYPQRRFTLGLLDGQGARRTHLDTETTQGTSFCLWDDRQTVDKGQALGASQAGGFHRVLKLARMIAELAGSESIQPANLAETIQYRPRRQG